LLPPAGPGPPAPQRPCQANTISSSAKLSPAADGLLGIITLAGPRCSLQVDPNGMRLLDASGEPLPISFDAGPTTNSAGSAGTDYAQAAGSVRVGFAWTGSYCGPPARSLEIPALPATVRIPLTGAEPACHHSTSSRLIPGIVDRPGAPVEPAATAWQSLRVRLVLPKTVKPGSVPVTVVFTNTGRTNVSLAAPCPTYAIGLTVPTVPIGNYGGTIAQTGGNAGDLCANALVVTPSKPLTVKLPAITALASDPRNPWRSGDTLQLDWTMAGVATAHATAVIQ
jgi:hypothetical protein